MRIDALRAFVTVAECGNIRDAADRLHRTPSAISMTLKQLEEHLGAPLFETDRKSKLTDLGAQVRAIASGLLRDHDRALEQIEAVAGGRLGVLHLAAVPSVAARILPAVIATCMRESPDVRIELIDTDSATVRTLVSSGAVELGIAGPPQAAPDLTFRPLFRDAFVVVCRADHPLAAQEDPVPWPALAGERLIGNEAARAIAAPEHQWLSAETALSARNVISLLALVSAGVGITLLPALATASLPRELRALPLVDPEAQRTVGLVTRQGRAASPVATLFERRVASHLRKCGEAMGLALA